MIMLPFFFPGYLLGSIPFGLLITKWAGLGDIRAIGSGNIGATNVLRTGRKGLAATTLLLDALKGAAAVLILGGLTNPEAGLWAGLGAVFGHLFPVWLGFKGGKGVATAFGVLIAAAWPIGLTAGAVWLAMAAIYRQSSLASLAAFVAAPVLAILFQSAGWVENWGVLYLSLTIAVLIFARHHANIRRLMAGTEPRIGQAGEPTT
jgi:glycerol-3-phosphate acyltransferase PlsY